MSFYVVFYVFYTKLLYKRTGSLHPSVQWRRGDLLVSHKKNQRQEKKKRTHPISSYPFLVVRRQYPTRTNYTIVPILLKPKMKKLRHNALDVWEKYLCLFPKWNWSSRMQIYPLSWIYDSYICSYVKEKTTQYVTRQITFANHIAISCYGAVQLHCNKAHLTFSF